MDGGNITAVSKSVKEAFREVSCKIPQFGLFE